MKSRIELIPDDIMNCPIYKTMELFQGKWTVWVLFELSKKETMRFGELRKVIPGISNTMLAATLKDLEERRLVERIQHNEIPPHVDYSATERAKGLDIVFKAMATWAKKYSD